MKLLRSIKSAFGKRILKSADETIRDRKGSNFVSAEKVAILYSDTDEPHFKKVKNYARFLKENYGIKNIQALCYVDVPEKKLPVWQSHKLEFEYFTRDDLNWYLRPVKNVSKFLAEEFDILIDLSGGREIPISFITAESKAKMKIGVKGSYSEKCFDLTIDMDKNHGLDKLIEQLNHYLSNSRIR